MAIISRVIVMMKQPLEKVNSTKVILRHARKTAQHTSLFVFRLVLRARQNRAQLVKIMSDTTQENV